MSDDTALLPELRCVRAVEHAAIAAAHWIGKLDEKAADQAAVDAMRRALNHIGVAGTVVIGEGERDEAPMLYIGEKVGSATSNTHVDIALDPLEGTTLCATNQPGSLSVMATAHEGNFLHAPDVYMQKIAMPDVDATDVLDIDAPVATNLANAAKAMGCEKEALQVIILNRPRHQDLMHQVRDAGASVTLIQDGDVEAVMRIAIYRDQPALYMGSGGAPEGVLAAAALRCLGGHMVGKLLWDNEAQIKRASEMGVKDPNRIYREQELAYGDIVFAACGVTSGNLLKGVRRDSQSTVLTHSLLLRSSHREFRKISTHHPAT